MKIINRKIRLEAEHGFMWSMERIVEGRKFGFVEVSGDEDNRKAVAKRLRRARMLLRLAVTEHILTMG